MSIEDDIPDPPSLDGPQPRSEYEAIAVDDDEDLEDDYRREELENFLQDGAWEDGFGEWADATSLTAEDFRPVVDLGLIDRFDFYWNPSDDQVGYISPTVPEEARDTLDREDIDEIENELDTLGRVVSEVLENDYLLRDDDDEQFGFFADDYTGDDSDDEE